MSGKWKPKRGPLGLDFGASSFKIIQGGWNGDVWTAKEAAFQSIPVTLPQDKVERSCLLKERLAGALSGASFNGREVISSLPASLWQCKSLRLPPMPTNELRTAVEWEAADRLHLGSDNYIQFYDAGEVQQGEDVKREVIVLATTHEVVDEHVDVLSGCGLTPIAIDIAPSALAYALANRGDSEEGTVTQFTVDVGAQSSKVVISRHGRVLFFKTIGIGVEQLDQAISNTLKVSIEEASQLRHTNQQSQDGLQASESAGQAVSDAIRPIISDLAREVALCLRYYSVTFRGYRPEALVVTGGGANTVTLVERFAQEVGLTVTPFGDLPQFDFSSISGRAASLPTSCWTVAAGLSLRPTAQQGMRGAA